MQLFLTASANDVLNDIVKRLPQKPFEYNLAFISTAADVETGDKWWLRADRDKLVSLGFRVTDVAISDKLENFNAIFVSGGNTFYLLDQAIKSGFDQILKTKLEQGTIYIGSSAGSTIIGKGVNLVSTVDDPSKAPDLTSDGLGIINAAILPHWGSSDFKTGYLASAESMYTESIPIILLNNKQYLWVDDNYQKIISV